MGIILNNVLYIVLTYENSWITPNWLFFCLNVFIFTSLEIYQVNVLICTPLWMAVYIEMFYANEKNEQTPILLDISTMYMYFSAHVFNEHR